VQQRISFYAFKHKHTTVTHYTATTRTKWVVSIQLASIPIIPFPCIGMQILKKHPHLILFMPETSAKMANMAAYSEGKHGLMLVTFPRYVIGSTAQQRRIVCFA
jgi:hypothetical protein